jgi:hypothetical protein
MRMKKKEEEEERKKRDGNIIWRLDPFLYCAQWFNGSTIQWGCSLLNSSYKMDLCYGIIGIPREYYAAERVASE